MPYIAVFFGAQKDGKNFVCKKILIKKSSNFFKQNITDTVRNFKTICSTTQKKLTKIIALKYFAQRYGNDINLSDFHHINCYNIRAF